MRKFNAWMKGWGALLIIAVLILSLVGEIVWLIVQWNQNMVTPEKATILIQQVVDANNLEGKVNDVKVSSPMCGQAVLGNSCRVDVQFKLDSQLMAGWCSFGTYQTPQCGILGKVQ